MKNVALITGASSGLGKEFARLHASKGGDLVIVARSVAKLEALAEELHDTYGTAVVVLPKDLSRPDAPQEIYDAVHDKGITIDILINNAGLGGQGAFVERSMEDDMNLLAIDVIALTKLTKLFLRDFLARDAGKILNVSSTAALMPGPLQATYYAAKAYVTSLGDALWQEAQGTHVTVTTLMPGGMDTGFAPRAYEPRQADDVPTDGNRQRRLCRHDARRHESHLEVHDVAENRVQAAAIPPEEDGDAADPQDAGGRLALI